MLEAKEPVKTLVHITMLVLVTVIAGLIMYGVKTMANMDNSMKVQAVETKNISQAMEQVKNTISKLSDKYDNRLLDHENKIGKLDTRVTVLEASKKRN